MSNDLDLYPDGFASLLWSSVDGGKTFQRFDFNLTTNSSWTSFAGYTNKTTGRRWAHDFGAPGEVLPGAGKTSFSSNFTFRYEFKLGTNMLLRSTGPPVSFSGLPYPICEADPRQGFTPYASGHITFSDGLHLQTGMYSTCAPSPNSQLIAAFTSTDGYNYKWLSNVSTSQDVPGSSEGPNEHDIALLPNGDVMSVFRTGAGDGKGQYQPYYMTKSNDRGKTWSKPVALRDTFGNYIGCARPHLVQLRNATLLSGGRMMMGHDYSRSFSIWMSMDAGATWTRADGSYHHNARAAETNAGIWPSSVNKTGWRFEFTSGYVGLVRVGENSANVVYDLMLPVTPPPTPPTPPPPTPPPTPPPPPTPCHIHIHHTVGCFNISDWKVGATGPVLPSYQSSVHGKLTIENCASACYKAQLALAGVEGGRDCFCGAASDLGTPAAKARSLPDKSMCEAIPCDGNAAQKGCGGKGTMLAYQFTCDKTSGNAEVTADAMRKAAEEEEDKLEERRLSHNPSQSYSMRIDVV
jgi:hypothetical protein